MCILYLPKTKTVRVVVLCEKAPLRKDGKYLGDVAWGKLRRIGRGEFQARGLALVRKRLADYHTREGTEKGEYDLLPKAERKKLDHRHHELWIWENANGSLQILDRRSKEQITVKTQNAETFFARLLDLGKRQL